MTNEEKQLLLKDLCARLPYGVKVDHFGVIRELLWVIPSSENVIVGYDINDYEDSVIDDIKPYLRPMSSMTKDDKIARNYYCGYKPYDEDCVESYLTEYVSDYMDWLLAHHFDFRGLIEKGLALEAPEDMYKTS